MQRPQLLLVEMQVMVEPHRMGQGLMMQGSPRQTTVMTLPISIVMKLHTGRRTRMATTTVLALVLLHYRLLRPPVLPLAAVRYLHPPAGAAAACQNRKATTTMSLMILPTLQMVLMRPMAGLLTILLVVTLALVRMLMTRWWRTGHQQQRCTTMMAMAKKRWTTGMISRMATMMRATSKSMSRRMMEQGPLSPLLFLRRLRRCPQAVMMTTGAMKATTMAVKVVPALALLHHRSNPLPRKSAAVLKAHVTR